MSVAARAGGGRELVVLGTSSQVPTRTRNHNGYLLRWDGAGLLLDPGEGTQRQLTHAGVASSAITRICLTHVHGVEHGVELHYPASGDAVVRALMDTAECAGAEELADGVDLLLVESTYGDEAEALAAEHLHLTSRQAAMLAARAGSRSVVLTHFSSRYADVTPLVTQAREAAPGLTVTAADDLDRFALPPRRA